MYFPPGDYTITGPLKPKSHTLLSGCHVPTYHASGNGLPSACKIRVRNDFSGAGLIDPPGTTLGWGIRNLALHGRRVGNGIHGLLLPGSDSPSHAFSPTFENVSIAGFSGSGIYGSLKVASLFNCHLADNQRWGLEVADGHSFTDSFVSHLVVYFNKLGGVLLGGSRRSGHLVFNNCRFERSGANITNIGDPLLASAPGVRITNAGVVFFNNCFTDANHGNGFEFVKDLDSDSDLPSNIHMTNCLIGRDGSGDTVSLGDFAGIKIKGNAPTGDPPKFIRLSNCAVHWGTAADDGSTSLNAPKYGVWYENTDHFQWIGGRCEGSPQGPTNNAFYTGTGANFGEVIFDAANGLLVVPTEAPAISGAGSPPNGSIYLDEANNQLRVRVNGVWKTATLA